MSEPKMIYVVSRDGMPVNSFDSEFDMLAWFHRKTPQSMAWAIRWDGYTISRQCVNPA